jgi:uncharacterized protein (TIGR03435 family)
MKTTGDTVGSHRRRLKRAAGYLALVSTIVFGLIGARPIQGQTVGDKAAAAAPVFEYEVSTVKLYKPGADEAGGGIRMGISNAPDAFSAAGVTLQVLLTFAYNVQNNQISGGPDWLNSERFQIDAKMDGSVADALQKMSPDERAETRRKMLQKLLAERFKMTIQKDTKELPVYWLTVGKNGSKLHEVEPPPNTPPGGSQGRGARGGPGTVQVGGRGPTQTLTAQAVPISALLRMLSGNVGRPVLDKTELKGVYDVKLEWAPEQPQGVAISAPDGGAPRGDSAVPTGEPTAPSIFVAVQEQLGLKLESGKGPIDLIVVKSAEKPSDN